MLMEPSPKLKAGIPFVATSTQRLRSWSEERTAIPAEPGPHPDLVAARTGDEFSARRLVGQHGASMLRTARRVLAAFRDRDGDDVVQEAFLAALTTNALPVGDLGAWLRAITVRKALDVLRRAKRRSEIPLDEPGDGEAEPAVLPAAPGIVDAGVVRLALEKLAPAERAILVLVDLEGYSMAEAAEILGTNRVAAKVRAFRARKKLALLLGAVAKPKKD